jgi:transposase
MLGSGLVISLHEQKAMGKSIRQIVRDTGISRNTIRKYLRYNGLPERKKRSKRGSKLDPFKPVLDMLLAQGIYNCEVLWERIREQGYTGGKTLVKDYVQPLRPPRRTPAVQRYETKPGEQAQVDWGIADYVDENGIIHKVPVFVMVLGYSRAMYIEFARRCDIRSFLRCLIHALEYFGGVPNVMLTDRMKTVILGVRDDRKPEWHPVFADFAAAVGMVPKVCRVRRPQTKGKVERGVQFVKDNFLPGRTFTDLGDLNTQARHWCDEKNRRIHGTTGERPCDRLPLEQLKPLPVEEVIAPFRFETRQVSRDGFVSFDGVRYGVPWTYSGREVMVRLLRGFVEIWADGQLIARHEQIHRSRAVVMLPGQYAGLHTAQGHAHPRPVARQIPAEQVETRSLDLYDRLAEVGA